VAASYQDDHASEVLALLPGQFEESALLRALVAASVGPSDPTTWGMQELEDVLWDMLTLRWLASASGQQLDDLGVVLDVPRPSSDDDEYRDLLYLQVLIDTSLGDPERMIAIVLRASGATLVHQIEHPPAAHSFYCHHISKFAWLARAAEAALAGVRTVITGSETFDPFVFGKDSDAAGALHGDELPFGHGWGESGAGNEDIGGDFTELFVQE